MSNEEFWKNEIDRMLKNSQTKVIFPIITWALVREYVGSSKSNFSDGEILAKLLALNQERAG